MKCRLLSTRGQPRSHASSPSDRLALRHGYVKAIIRCQPLPSKPCLRCVPRRDGRRRQRALSDRVLLVQAEQCKQELLSTPSSLVESLLASLRLVNLSLESAFLVDLCKNFLLTRLISPLLSSPPHFLSPILSFIRRKSPSDVRDEERTTSTIRTLEEGHARRHHDHPRNHERTCSSTMVGDATHRRRKSTGIIEINGPDGQRKTLNLAEMSDAEYVQRLSLNFLVPFPEILLSSSCTL